MSIMTVPTIGNLSIGKLRNMLLGLRWKQQGQQKRIGRVPRQTS